MKFIYIILLLSASVFAADLHILHTNDLHSFISPSAQSKGFEWISGYIEQYKKAHPETLALDAGDFLQGTPASAATQGHAIVSVLNTIQYDATTIGNHEFDYGMENMKKIIKNLRYPVVSTNVVTLSGKPVAEPYIIKHINGLKIAILGFTTPMIPTLTVEENYAGHRILDARILDRYIKMLYQKTDLIILLSHCGYEEDKILADSIFGIDVIISAHSHTLPEELFHSPKNGTLVVQAKSYGSYIGQLVFSVNTPHTIENPHWKAVESGSIEVIPAVRTKKAVRAVNSKLGSIFGKVIGRADGEFTRTGWETTVGNLVCDIMKEKSGADIALQNPGGLRIDIPKGPVTVGDIWSLCPFDNEIVQFKMSGKDIREMMNYQLSEFFAGRSEGPMQVSGLKYIYDIKKGEFLAFSLNDNTQYSIVMNDFMAKQGKYYFARNLDDYEKTGFMIRDAVLEFIKQKGSVKPISEGRIQMKE